jgi:ribosomal protein S17E
MNSRPAEAKLVRLSQKQNKNKIAGSITQVVELLPSECKTLGSISHHCKEKEKKESN